MDHRLEHATATAMRPRAERLPDPDHLARRFFILAVLGVSLGIGAIVTLMTMTGG